jgi:drug/metabolite transporter (DMT)-like permease
MLAPFAFAHGVPELGLEVPLGMLGLGAVSAVCHFLTVAAYQRTEASLLSPFLYFNLIAALAIGFLWFGETPTTLSLAGLAGIALGGLVAAGAARLPGFGRRRPDRLKPAHPDGLSATGW